MDHLLELAVGHDERPVVPGHEAKSIGNEITFSSDIADAEHLQDILDELADKVARRLRSQGFLARTITLKARYGDFSTFTRSESLTEATDSTVIIRDTARRLLNDKLGRRGRALRLIGVTAGNSHRPAATRQASSFPDPARHRDRQLDRVMDEVHDRFGAKLPPGAEPQRDGESSDH